MASVIDNTGTLKMTVGSVVIYAAKNICTVSEDGTNVSVRYSPTQQFEYLATAFTAPSGTAASIAAAIAAMITSGGGAGTVTSVGLSLPSDLLTVSGSPVTGAGTLTGSKTSQNQNLFYASPSGSSGSPSFRALVSDDMPSGVLKNGIGIAAGTTIIGGTGTTDDLTFRTTSGAGTTGADFIWQSGNNGGTELMRLLNGGQLGIGMTPVNILDITQSQNATSIISLLNPGVGTLAASSLLLGMSSIRKVSLQYINQGYTLVAGSESISTADTGVLLSGTTTTALHYVAANASGNHKFYTAGIASSNERMRIAANGNTTLTPSSASLGNLIVATSTGGSSGVSVGIGTITAPTYGIDILSNDSFVAGVRTTLYTAGNAPAWITRNSRGSIASPTTLLDNDVIGAFAFLGNKNTTPTFAYGGYFSCEVDGVPSTNIPSRFVFKTSTAAGAALVEAMRINAAQNVGIQTGATITAKLHLGAGTATASTSPQKYTAGALLTVIEAFAKEANGQGTYQTSNALNRCAEGGAIVDYFTDANNTGTGETDLYTYTTKANTFAANGEKLEAWYSGTFNDLTATSQLKVYFAGTAIADTGALTVSAIGGWKIDVALIRVSSTVVRYVVNISTPGASTAIYTSSGELTGLTLSNTNIIKITGTAGGGTGGNSDITAKSGSIYWYGSAAN